MIEAQKATYTVKRMCALLEVSRSGFYKWRKNRDDGPSPSQQRRAQLDAQVAQFHQASDGVYGAPRILADLRDAGARVSRKTVAASLRRQGLAGISPRAIRAGHHGHRPGRAGTDRPGEAPFRRR